MKQNIRKKFPILSSKNNQLLRKTNLWVKMWQSQHYILLKEQKNWYQSSIARCSQTRVKSLKRIEFQARGAPHIHCLLWMEDEERNKPPSMWNENKEDNRLCVDLQLRWIVIIMQNLINIMKIVLRGKICGKVSKWQAHLFMQDKM